MPSRKARILILCKTYPSPSGKHVETSCVAGFEQSGGLIRLFPVPFRFVSDGQQFKKWQWIDVRIEKATGDRRPESHKVFVDTISCSEQPISTKNGWSARREILSKIQVHSDFEAVEEARISGGATLALLKPEKILSLEITPADRADWTDDEREKLMQHERQAGFFEDVDAKKISTLRKVPFDFHYHYVCEVNDIKKEYRHKIVDWEAGALYWTCRKSHGENWEQPFRAKLETSLPKADLMFLMGTIHRFPNQWLIVSLIYPPKQPIVSDRRQSLFDL